MPDLPVDPPAPADGHTGVIVSKDDDQRLVFGWANIARDTEGRVIVDRQGDWTTVEELEKSAYDFVLNSRDGGVQHVTTGVSTVVESMVFTKEKLAKLGIPEGTVAEGWWVGFKVHDDEVWKGVKAGEYVDFSIHGSGRRRPTPVGKAAPPTLRRKMIRRPIVTKRDVSTKQREKLAAKGKALPDGSFPIASKADLQNAVKAFGRAKDQEKAKAHIIAQARRLNALDLLPPSWGVSKLAMGGTSALQVMQRQIAGQKSAAKRKQAKQAKKKQAPMNRKAMVAEAKKRGYKVVIEEDGSGTITNPKNGKVLKIPAAPAGAYDKNGNPTKSRVSSPKKKTPTKGKKK